jgi:pilus assembly protein CpaB
MSLYTKLKIIISIILAAIISIAAYSYMSSLSDEETIVLAAVDIPRRVWIKPDMLKEVKIRKSDRNILAPNAITDISHLENAISLTDIKSGKVLDKHADVITGSKEMLMDENIINRDGSINDAYFIKKNQRLVTVRVDSHGAVSNTLKAGDFVDIIFSYSDGSKSFSIDILQHIEVYSVQKISSDKGESAQNITLVATPQQAVDIVFAKRNGTIDLVLNTESGEKELIAPTSLDKFMEQFLLK